jgi:hypothetical protein
MARVQQPAYLWAPSLSAGVLSNSVATTRARDYTTRARGQLFVAAGRRSARKPLDNRCGLGDPPARGLESRQVKQPAVVTFDTVRTVGLTLPNVEATTRYDGSPVLKVDGVFMAGVATHRSAETETLVVRVGFEEREWLLEDAPETYYVTDYYRPYPVVLVRLAHIDRDALRDVLSVSWRLTVAKTRKRGGTRRHGDAVR